MKKKLSQVQVLAKELAKRPLTGKQIENELGIMNYKGRISDLRAEIDDYFYGVMFYWQRHGFIATEMINKKTRWGNSRIAKYFVDKGYLRHYKGFVKHFCKPAH